MARSGGRVRTWFRQRWVEGVLHTLERSPDRAATLMGLRGRIGDEVLDGMLNRSYLALRRGDDGESLAWADLAVEASLHDGTSRGRAEALVWQAGTYLGHRPKKLWDRVMALQTAEHGVGTALDILASIGPPGNVIDALVLRARIRAAQGATAGAFTDAHTAVVLALQGADGDQLAATTRQLVGWFGCLTGDDERRVATELLAIGDQLLRRIGDDPVSAALLGALGQAHLTLDDEAAALRTWATARRQYADRDDGAGLFMIDGHLFQLAFDHDRYDEALVLGARCLANAPADTSPDVLGRRHHLLAAAHRELDQVDAAVAEYDRAIELAEADPMVPASWYRFEAAVYDIELGSYASALNHLAVVRTTPADRIRWLAAVTVAEVRMSHLGDTAGALRAADDALEIVITAANSSYSDTLDAPVFRAHSLLMCGIAAFSAGDAETAYRRFTAVLPLLDHDQKIALIDVTPTYTHPIVPPLRTRCLWWAHLASQQSGRLREAADYLTRCIETSAGNMTDPEFAMDDSDLAELRPQFHAFAAFQRGAALLGSDPQHALDDLLAASRVLTAGSLPNAVVAQVHVTLGFCQRRLGALDDAKASFQTAMLLLDDADSNLEVELGCRIGLAAVATAERDLVSAEPHLNRCVELSEDSRRWFSGVDERIRFLTSRLSIYEQLIAVRIALNRPTEAYATVQLVKSRTLGELLAEPEHRPIDYTIETDVAAVRRLWDDWIGAYLHPMGSAFPERTELKLLTAAEERHDRHNATETTRRERGLFEGLSTHEPPLSYEAVQALLRL